MARNEKQLIDINGVDGSTDYTDVHRIFTDVLLWKPFIRDFKQPKSV
ncbi:MAG: hypothetical protein RIS64_303 [Bacteroidota bacterium]|jgi:hypothetical protein